MTPSASILAAASACITVVSEDGHKIAIRRLTAVDRLRLFKAAGPVLSQNQPWLGMAVLASSVTALDEVPVPPPVTEQQIEALIARLGDAGIDAVAEALASQSAAEAEIDPGNSVGTPI